MKRILLDENFSAALRGWLPRHDLRTAVWMGWIGLENGALVQAAEEAGFDIFLTADKNLRYQQNIARRQLAIVVLGSNRLPLIKANSPFLEAAIERCQRGTYIELEFRPLRPTDED